MSGDFIGLEFVEGAPPLATSILGFGAQIIPAVSRTMEMHAYLLHSKIQANAQGRPGPRRITGDYLRSWQVVPLEQYGGHGWFVGTNAPQGPRLESGFHGVDVLGRHYDQPAFPHVGPAIDWIEPRFFGAVDLIVQKALQS